MRWALVTLSACTFSPQPSGTSNNTPDASRSAADARESADGAMASVDAPAPHGAITIATMMMGSQDIDLSADGTLDWAHWGRSSPSSFDHKSPAANLISNLTTTPSFNFSGAPLTASWSNGTPTGSMSHTSTGVGATSIDATLQFTVAAGTTSHVLQLYVGAQLANASLDVSLSDGSAPHATASLSAPAGTTNVRYTITFNAASEGQSLVVKWDDTADFSLNNAFAAMLSATLQ